MPPKARAALFHLVSVAVVAVFVVPGAWLVATSLRLPGLPPPTSIEWWPNPPAWSNYARVFELVPLARYAFNSLTVTGVGVVLATLVAAWAGFVLAQTPRAWHGFWVMAVLTVLVVPPVMLWWPRLWLYRDLGWLSSWLPLWAPALLGGTPINVLLFFWAARRVPADVIEAARADGASAWQVWRWVVWPLSRAAWVPAMMLAAVLFWGDSVSPLLYLRSTALATVPVGLDTLLQLDRSDWPILMAAVVLASLPPVLLLMAVQRWLWRGLDDLTRRD